LERCGADRRRERRPYQVPPAQGRWARAAQRGAAGGEGRRRRSAAKVGGAARWGGRGAGRRRHVRGAGLAGEGGRSRAGGCGAGGAGRRGRVRGAEVARAQAARAARAAGAERSLRHVLPAEVGVVPALGSRREAGATGTSGGGGTVAWEALGCAKKGGDGRLAAWKGWRRGRRGLPASSSGGPRRRGEAPSLPCSGRKTSSILNPRKELLASRPLAAPRGSEGMPL